MGGVHIGLSTDDMSAHEMVPTRRTALGSAHQWDDWQKIPLCLPLHNAKAHGCEGAGPSHEFLI